MSGRLAALFGIVGAVVLGGWFHKKRQRHAATVSEETISPSSGIELDDDAAAEIIRRARPALERAREVALTTR